MQSIGEGLDSPSLDLAFFVFLLCCEKHRVELIMIQPIANQFLLWYLTYYSFLYCCNQIRGVIAIECESLHKIRRNKVTDVFNSL